MIVIVLSNCYCIIMNDLVLCNKINAISYTFDNFFIQFEFEFRVHFIYFVWSRSKLTKSTFMYFHFLLLFAISGFFGFKVKIIIRDKRHHRAMELVFLYQKMYLEWLLCVWNLDMNTRN